jgi:hypothetical protein
MYRFFIATVDINKPFVPFFLLGKYRLQSERVAQGDVTQQDHL